MNDPLEILWTEIASAELPGSMWSDVWAEYIRLYNQGPKAKAYKDFLLS